MLRSAVIAFTRLSDWQPADAAGLALAGGAAATLGLGAAVSAAGAEAGVSILAELGIEEGSHTLLAGGLLLGGGAAAAFSAARC